MERKRQYLVGTVFDPAGSLNEDFEVGNVGEGDRVGIVKEVNHGGHPV